jgi:protein-tyrosine-phosphatase
MTAALLEHPAAGRVYVRPAGSTPANEINPRRPRRHGRNRHRPRRRPPKLLTIDAVQASDVVVTMGCGDTCPIYPGKRFLDCDLTDPAGQALEQIRPIRDDMSWRSSTRCRRAPPAADQIVITTFPRTRPFSSNDMASGASSSG